MIIRKIWPNCPYRNHQRDVLPVIHAFWLEATKDEAFENIFPRLDRKHRDESERAVAEYGKAYAQWCADNRPYCFLVAHDLSTIDPFHPFYPVHHMWNAYSPFREYPETTIQSLEEIKSLRVNNEDYAE